VKGRLVFYQLQTYLRKTRSALIELMQQPTPVEMYDLHNDPNEYNNVVNVPGYRQMQELLIQVLNRHITENLDRERLVKALTTPTDGKFGLS